MQRPWAWWGGVALLSAGLISVRSDTLPAAHRLTPRMEHLPRLTVWTWERREDLRGVDPATTAVAYLDRTIVLDGRGMTVVPRRQPLLLPASSTLVQIVVVRIEAGESAPLNDTTAEEVARAAVEAAGRHASALQIDFDARLSEREWYREVLRRVRANLPSQTPLSITALASWCSYDNAWMHGLPVDEAVPMLFRMEPDRRRAAALGRLGGDEFTLREPLCMDSVGISTHERWPAQMAGKRIYIFPDAGWHRDNLEETVKQLW